MIKHLITILCLSLAASFAPASAATLSLNVLSAPVAGSTFDVELIASGVFDPPHDGIDALLSYGFNFVLGGPELVYVSFSPGSLFTSTTTSADISAAASSVFIIAGDFVEPLSLGIMTFSAISAGPSSITISSDLLDTNTGLGYLSTIDQMSATTNVSVGESVPEPGTMALMILGGAGLVVLRQRKA